MKQRLLSLWCGLMVSFVAPALAMAEDEAKEPLARFEGFARSVKVESSSLILAWAALLLVGALCVAVLFKDAKRTHLD
jgi:hypothetical protein